MDIATATTAPAPPQTRTDAVIELRGVRRHFGIGERKVKAVDGLDLKEHTFSLVVHTDSTAPAEFSFEQAAILISLP